MTHNLGYLRNIMFCRICNKPFYKTSYFRRFCYECINKGKHLGFKEKKEKNNKDDFY